MITNTASIGNAVLKSSLSLIDNFSITERYEEVNRLSSGCYQCSSFIEGKADLLEICAQCPSKMAIEKSNIRYINEKNRYGERPILLKNALLLFMFLHFLNPDANGFVKLDIEDAATAIGCTERTIKNNLRLLCKREYISTSLHPAIPGLYNIFLSEYKTYFLPANKGGRGYSVISKDCFDKFKEMPDINSLRLAIRNILPGIEHKSSSYNNGYERTYKEVKRVLPNYVTKGQIQRIIKTESFAEIFHVRAKKRFIAIEAKDNYSPLRIADQLRSDCRNGLLALADKINETAKKNKIKYQLKLSDDDITDICNISLKIHIPFILAAVQEAYSNYIAKNQKVKSLGALVRTIAEFRAEFQLTA